MPKITTIILAETATQLLTKAIHSVKLANFILVIDTSGKLTNFKIPGIDFKIIRYPKLLTNFSTVRNWALTQVETDWVLFLDSDEQLEPRGINHITQILSQTQASALAVSRSDIYLNKLLRFGEAGHQSLPRIFQRNQIRYIGSVHERPQVLGQILPTNIQIRHLSHPNISQFLSTVNSYAQLMAWEKTHPQSEGLLTIWLKLLTFPPGKLFYNLIIKQGLRDGWRGLVYAVMMSFHSLLVRIYQLELIYGKKK
ncbi:MAG: glycosyltransferase [Patescibacteria group bacterium]|nr:glycosyltransferase [Patescibacteria group bacterium]